jgi:hypothetical protein
LIFSQFELPVRDAHCNLSNTAVKGHEKADREGETSSVGILKNNVSVGPFEKDT